MKKLLLTTFACCTLFSSLQTYAQTFRPGFIVQAAGDTTQGLVKYREGKQNYLGCIFKTGPEAEVREYFPNDIIAYGIASQAPFASKEVPDTTGAQTRSFVEVLEQGSLNLYTQHNRLYLEKGNSGLRLLRLVTDEEGIIKYTGEISTVTTSTQHLILINSLTYDCPVPEHLMLKVRQRLYVPDVTAIVRGYNNCAAPNSSKSYKEKQSWLKVEAGVFAGGYSTALKFSHKTSVHTFRDASFPTTHNVVLGALFNFTSPMKSERLSVQAEPMYSQERHNRSFNSPSASYVIRGDYKIDMKRLSVPILLRYTITTNGRFVPYIGVGLANDYILSSSVTGVQETEYSNGHIEKRNTTNEVGTKISHALTAAFGSKFKLSERQNILLQFRYEHGRYLASDPSHYMDPKVYLNREHTGIYLTAAYLFR